MVKDASEEHVKGEAVHVPPKERLEFRKLLVTNPNYFGNLEKSAFKPVNKIVGNTTYEEITCKTDQLPGCIAQPSQNVKRRGLTVVTRSSPTTTGQRARQGISRTPPRSGARCRSARQR